MSNRLRGCIVARVRIGGDKDGPVSEFEKILVANRGEIAIQVLRAANEMGKATVAVFIPGPMPASFDRTVNRAR